MNTKLTLKSKLATVIAISLLLVFGVETMAVASSDSSNPFAESTIVNNDDDNKCPGDRSDAC